MMIQFDVDVDISRHCRINIAIAICDEVIEDPAAVQILMTKWRGMERGCSQSNK